MEQNCAHVLTNANYIYFMYRYIGKLLNSCKRALTWLLVGLGLPYVYTGGAHSISIMITPRMMLSDLIFYYSYQMADNKNDRLQSISSETIKDKCQALVTWRLVITSGQNSKNVLTANKTTWHNPLLFF